MKRRQEQMDKIMLGIFGGNAERLAMHERLVAEEKKQLEERRKLRAQIPQDELQYLIGYEMHHGRLLWVSVKDGNFEIHIGDSTAVIPAHFDVEGNLFNTSKIDKMEDEIFGEFTDLAYTVHNLIHSYIIETGE